MNRIRLSINIIGISIFCLYAALAACFTSCKQGNQRISLHESSGLDTIIKATWNFGYFQLYYNHVVEGGNYPENAFDPFNCRRADTVIFVIAIQIWT